MVEHPAQNAQILLLHAPYPGISKFAGQPSSLLYAATPLIEAFGADHVSIYDPDCQNAEYYRRLEAALPGMDQLRVVGISTSTAAIVETERISDVVKRHFGDRVIVMVGGPHEDDIEEKTAHRLPNVDLSVAGDAEFVIAKIVELLLVRSDLGATAASELTLDECVGWTLAAGSATLSTRHGAVRQIQLLGPAITSHDLAPRARIDRLTEFAVFGGALTHEVMISRGCSYGKCTFCAEAIQGPSVVMDDVQWLKDLVGQCTNGQAVYFQDSIFPLHARVVKEQVLPALSESGVTWGCQVFLGSLTAERIELLRSHNCSYVYTGLESGVHARRVDVGKMLLTDDRVSEQFSHLAASKMQVGISVMFGALSDGRVRETVESVESTIDYAASLIDMGLNVAGFYPNVQTLLPGTPAANAFDVDYYTTPLLDAFDVLEDGGVGYNFATIEGLIDDPKRDEIVESVVQATAQLRKITETSGTRW